MLLTWEQLPVAALGASPASLILGSRHLLGDVEQNPLSCPAEHSTLGEPRCSRSLRLLWTLAWVAPLPMALLSFAGLDKGSGDAGLAPDAAWGTRDHDAKVWGDESISEPHRDTVATLPAPCLEGSTAGSHPANHGTRLFAALPIPQAASAFTGLFNDGNLISLHCTSSTSHPHKNQLALVAVGAVLPAFAPARGSASEQSPRAAFRTPLGPKWAWHGAPAVRRSALTHAVPWGAAASWWGGEGSVMRSRCTASVRGRCGCLWPPASFPSSQAKSRACYQAQKMCHLCCISFPFLHLFPARCASEITAPRAEAGAWGRQRPRQPYHCLTGRKEIRKFAEIFDRQNKHFSCQPVIGSLVSPQQSAPLPSLQPSGQRCPARRPPGPRHRTSGCPLPGVC